MFKKRDYVQIIKNIKQDTPDDQRLEPEKQIEDIKIDIDEIEDSRMYNQYENIYEDTGGKYRNSDGEDDEDEDDEGGGGSDSDKEDDYEDGDDEDYMKQNEDIVMVNEWNANKRTGVIIDVYEKNEKNKEFNKNIYVYSKNINEDINDLAYEINEGDIKNIQILAGKIDEIEYRNPVCFALAYKFISMNKKKNEYLNFVNTYIPIINDRFGYMNIGKKDLVRYIIFVNEKIKTFT